MRRIFIGAASSSRGSQRSSRHTLIGQSLTRPNGGLYGWQLEAKRPLRMLANRPHMDFYELHHAAATMLPERGATPWDVAHQLGHTDGGQLVMELYGHPAEAGARSRLLATWDAVEPLRPVSGSSRDQAHQPDTPQRLPLHAV